MYIIVVSTSWRPAIVLLSMRSISFTSVEAFFRTRNHENQDNPARPLFAAGEFAEALAFSTQTMQFN
jgi:hypothetical protein